MDGGSLFNKPINKLPSQLKFLYFCPNSNFNEKIHCEFPDKLEYLSLNNNFNQDIKFWPKTLRFLHVGKSYNIALKNLPENLKELECCIHGLGLTNIFEKIPKSIRYLTILDNNLEIDKFCEINNIPDNLISLQLRYIQYGSDIGRNTEKEKINTTSL